jgi:hypothetical protein
MTTPATYKDFVHSRFKYGESIVMDAFDNNLYNQFSRLHAVIGLITELDEIQQAVSHNNFIEEIGDYYFYLVGLESCLPSAYHYAREVGDYKTWEDARHYSAVLLDLCKRECMYCKALSEIQVEEFMIHATHMRSYFEFVISDIGMSEEQIQEHNMAKLEKRYPVGYTNEAANARADKKEGEV